MVSVKSSVKYNTHIVSQTMDFFYRCHTFLIFSFRQKMSLTAQFIMPNLENRQSFIGILSVANSQKYETPNLPSFTKNVFLGASVAPGILLVQKYGLIFLSGHRLFLKANRKCPWTNIQGYFLCPMEAIKCLYNQVQRCDVGCKPFCSFHLTLTLFQWVFLLPSVQ